MSFFSLLELAVNSFLAHFILPLKSEVVWFSLLSFGEAAMLLPTLAAIIASSAALAVSYGLGWLLARDRHNMPIPEGGYERGQKWARFFVPLFLVAWVPLLPVFALVLGFLRVWPYYFLAAMVTGRVVFYSYYLLMIAKIVNFW